MSEQPDRSPADTDEGSRASVGRDPAQLGHGRTEGETSVDDALGQGTSSTDER